MRSNVFWIGDLNYRIDLDYDLCLQKIKEKDWAYLNANEQVRLVWKPLDAFHGLTRDNFLYKADE